MFDAKAFAGDLARVTKAAIAKEIAPLMERLAEQDRQIAELKAMQPLVPENGKDGVNGEDGRDGVDGKDGASVTLDDVRPLIEEGIAKAISLIPPPENGKDGRDGHDGIDGKSFDPEEVQRLLALAAEAHLKTLPIPENGRDGADGKDGRDGVDGTDGKSVAVEDLQAHVEMIVSKTVAALPAPAPGRDGRDGFHGRDGTNGEKGLDGKDGRDGLDGLGFDDLTVEHDGERTVTLKFVRGEQVKEFPVELVGVPLDRGVYREGHQYAKGDGVTWGGSVWWALKDTTSKPDAADGSWRLAVKRGRDGRDGEQGPKGEPGKPVPTKGE